MIPVAAIGLALALRIWNARVAKPVQLPAAAVEAASAAAVAAR
jgi:hypothetical protein